MMIEPGRTNPTIQKDHQTYWRKPGIWVLALIVVVFVVGYRTKQVADQQAVQAAATQARFEQHLAAEDFQATAQDLLDYSTKTDPWHLEATKRLETAKSTAETYQQAKVHLENRQWDDGIRLLPDVTGYKDTSDLLQMARFEAALDAVKAQKWWEALNYLSFLPSDYPGTADVKTVAANEYTTKAYAEAMDAKGTADYASAERLLEEAKKAGGKAPGDVDAQLTVVRELRVKVEAAARIEDVRKNMNYYTRGPLGLAVSNANFRSKVGNRVSAGNGTFVLIYASVLYEGPGSEHANPNNFKLSTPDGYTVSHHNGTYGLNGYFDAVDLGKGQKTAGWLAFYLPKAETYTLYYEGFQGDASKKIAPE